MGVIKTKGIIISEHNSGDFDKVLIILTPDLGKITCFAKNVRRPKSTFLAGTSLFAFSNIIVYKGAGSYKLNSCETIEVFYNLRIDLDKLNIATYITQLINNTTYENAQSYRILQLYLNTLYMISETEKEHNFIETVFKIRLMCLLGYTPIVNKCCICGTKEEIISFSFKDNGVKCNLCSKLDTGVVEANPSTIQALRYIVYSEAKKIFNFEVSEQTLKELKMISDIYMKDKLQL